MDVDGGEVTEEVEEALAFADGVKKVRDMARSLVGVFSSPAEEHLITLAAEVRACQATIARMIVEREDLERELAKWRGQPSRMS